MTHGMSDYVPERRTGDQWRTRFNRGMTIQSDIPNILRDWELEKHFLLSLLTEINNKLYECPLCGGVRMGDGTSHSWMEHEQDCKLSETLDNGY